MVSEVSPIVAEWQARTQKLTSYYPESLGRGRSKEQKEKGENGYKEVFFPLDLAYRVRSPPHTVSLLLQLTVAEILMSAYYQSQYNQVDNINHY